MTTSNQGINISIRLYRPTSRYVLGAIAERLIVDTPTRLGRDRPVVQRVRSLYWRAARWDIEVGLAMVLGWSDLLSAAP